MTAEVMYSHEYSFKSKTWANNVLNKNLIRESLSKFVYS